MDKKTEIQKGRKVLISEVNQTCMHCRGILVGSKQVIAQNIIVFAACGHNYHQNCLAQIGNLEVCTRCERFIISGKFLIARVTNCSQPREGSRTTKTRIRISIVSWLASRRRSKQNKTKRHPRRTLR